MILVTGGTGLVGAHLLYELVRAGEKIRAIHRENSDLNKVLEVFSFYSEAEEAEKLFHQIEWKVADLNNIPQLTAAFVEVQQVYHSAALVSFDPADEQELRKVNIEGTANIVNLCISCKVHKLCFVSSIAALGNITNADKIDETGKWNPEGKHNDYAISKYGAEIEVWRGTQEGVNAIIVNPGVIIGPGFWNSGSGKIFKKIDSGLSYYFPKVTGFVGVQDVAKSMVILMNSEKVNEQYVLVSENISFRQVFEWAAKALNKTKPKQKLQKWMIAFGWFFQKTGSIFGRKRSITYETINSLHEESFYDNSKIIQEINYQFEPMESAVKRTASNFKN
ncbi:NAD-dependent epimerase/dehydratase family protein [Christiangramia sp. OXR-203]|jgi:nucleoside-diphosphate-sugar epimerase|uniref:NAD-dependent epimerase/dehydratase family protein n=1 Tax=Christiangramia sp. OXR-203 TaxID=3100176 RepID=UPI002AC9EBBB|nr:NAD-dependent epimerase/dehydratase family protein [Christiangramia sp. OXR-203]WPY98294.1 NAD-dependent epimerase/dehydratase family protein [Christiangramia sp. OXR-203]